MIDDLTEEKLRRYMKVSPVYVMNMCKFLPPHFQEIVVSDQPYLITHVENPSEDMQIMAVSKKSDAIKMISNPTEVVQHLSIGKNILNIEHINNPCMTVVVQCMQANPYFTTQQLCQNNNFKFTPEIVRLACSHDKRCVTLLREELDDNLIKDVCFDLNHTPEHVSIARMCYRIAKENTTQLMLRLKFGDAIDDDDDTYF